MRNLRALLFLICISFSVHLCAQGKTAYANFQMTEPGEVKFPAGVKKLVLANRSYQKTFFPDRDQYSYLYELQKLLLSSNSYAVDILQVDSIRNKDPENSWATKMHLIIVLP